MIPLLLLVPLVLLVVGAGLVCLLPWLAARKGKWKK